MFFMKSLRRGRIAFEGQMSKSILNYLCQIIASGALASAWAELEGTNPYAAAWGKANQDKTSDAERNTRSLTEPNI